MKTGPFADTHGKNRWDFYETEPARGENFYLFMTKWNEGLSCCFGMYPVKIRLSDAWNKPEDIALLFDVGGDEDHVLQEHLSPVGGEEEQIDCSRSATRT